MMVIIGCIGQLGRLNNTTDGLEQQECIFSQFRVIQGQDMAGSVPGEPLFLAGNSHLLAMTSYGERGSSLVTLLLRTLILSDCAPYS
jgi:hypothetical protein